MENVCIPNSRVLLLQPLAFIVRNKALWILIFIFMLLHKIRLFGHGFLVYVAWALQDVLHLHDVLARVSLARLCSTISRARALDGWCVKKLVI